MNIPHSSGKTKVFDKPTKSPQAIIKIAVVDPFRGAAVSCFTA
jgi:hypothetical protein